MVNDLEALRAAAMEEIAAAQNDEALQQVRTAYLGRKGKITALLRNIPSLAPEERGPMGKAANDLKKAIGTLADERSEALLDQATTLPPGFDPTLPGMASPIGGLHPITQMIYDLNDAFATLGFEVYDGPEISSELFAFDSLNFPPDHPARETMDTYWLEGRDNASGKDRLCLRPHLTGGSVRFMQSRKPPFRFVYPGRVYRNETTDASHERAFFQYEALIIEEKLPFSAGKLLVDTILTTVFGRQVPIRMRAGFFPFVEPGFEIDMQCLVCEGAGCKVCKHVGWLEVMPGGPPPPRSPTRGGTRSRPLGGLLHQRWSRSAGDDAVRRG